jgi:predicted dienelactone hydrolase
MTVRVLAIVVVLVPATLQAMPLDPSADGPFPVGVTTVTLVDAARQRSLVTEVWYPARMAGRDAVPRRGRYPLVLAAHGFCGFRTNYEYLTIPLAARGFVVAAPDFPEFTKSVCDAGTPSADTVEPAKDLSFLRATLHDRLGPVATLAQVVRGRRTGLVGHSLGGTTVIGAALADPDMQPVVTLAPFPLGGTGAALAALDPRPAVLVVVGTADILFQTDETFFGALVSPAFLVTITGGTHSGLTDMDSHLTPDALAREETLARRYTVATLERYLVRERRFARFLTPADAAAEGADLALTAAD